MISGFQYSIYQLFKSNIVNNSFECFDNGRETYNDTDKTLSAILGQDNNDQSLNVFSSPIESASDLLSLLIIHPSVDILIPSLIAISLAVVSAGYFIAAVVRLAIGIILSPSIFFSSDTNYAKDSVISNFKEAAEKILISLVSAGLSVGLILTAGLSLIINAIAIVTRTVATIGAGITFCMNVFEQSSHNSTNSSDSPSDPDDLNGDKARASL